MARILIVDDSRTSRKVLRNLLESNGHEIVGEAKDGAEGVELYSSLKPDLVTMDITMPIMDGIEALKNIRNADNTAKIIMVTAAGQKTKMLEAIKYGAAEFLAKPFEADQIKDIVSKVIEK